MNRVLIGTLCLLVGFLLGAGLIWLVTGGDSSSDPVLVITPELLESAEPQEEDGTSRTGQSEQSAVTQLALYAVGLIKQEDYEGLSRLVHPEFGLIFSPYATVSLTSDLCFSAEQVAEFPTDTSNYVWGAYDGIGDPIELTPMDYIERFVWDRDYAEAPVIGYNTILETGNALETVTDAFPDGQFVEFHYPDTGDGHDWRTLRLVFEQYQNTYVLTAVIHSEWTV